MLVGVVRRQTSFPPDVDFRPVAGPENHAGFKSGELEGHGHDGAPGDEAPALPDAGDLAHAALPVKVTENELVACGQTIGGDGLCFHCGNSPTRGRRLVLFGSGFGESGADSPPARAAVSGPGPGDGLGP